MPLGVEVNPELEEKVVVFLCQGLRSFDTYGQGSSYANMYGCETILGQLVHSKVAPLSFDQALDLIDRRALEPRVRLI